MATAGQGAAAEWRRYFMLPIAAALGYATSVIHVYGLSAYVVPISNAFGWSRTQVTAGLTVSILAQAVVAIPIGILVDRVGPRLLGVVGVLLTCGGFALLSLASGDKLQWYFLWAAVALGTMPIQATVWTSAVATRFDASRGLAFAVTLSGAAVATSGFPFLATRLIEAYGWQNAFALHGLIWAAIAFPVILIFFRSAKDGKVKSSPTDVQAPEASAGLTLAEGLRSSIYLRLFVAATFFTFTIVALTFHFLLILQGKGLDPVAAARGPFIVGMGSIVGRLGTGFLLDRFRGSLVGAAAFLLPALGCLCLLFAGSDPMMQLVAAALIGLTLGAETDVIAYLTTQHFGLKAFGALYGGLLAALALGTAFGPLAASAIFDAFGHYEPFLWLTIGCMLIASMALASLPSPAYGRASRLA